MEYYYVYIKAANYRNGKELNLYIHFPKMKATLKDIGMTENDKKPIRTKLTPRITSTIKK